VCPVGIYFEFARSRLAVGCGRDPKRTDGACETTGTNSDYDLGSGRGEIRLPFSVCRA